MSDSHCWEDLLGSEERLLVDAFSGDRDLGSRPAVLMIDLYNKAFGDKKQPLEEAMKRFPSSAGPSAWDAITPLEELLETARATNIPIAHSTGEHRAESQLGGSTQRSGWQEDSNEWGYSFFKPLRPEDGEFVVRKTRASAFFGSPLAAWLRKTDVDTLVIAGESTSGCVRASVVDAYSLGFKIAVVEEGVFDRSPLSHKVNLFDMNLKYANVIGLDEAKSYLVKHGRGLTSPQG